MGKDKGGQTPAWLEGIANRQVGIGERSAALGEQFANIAKPYLTKAGDYWSALLSGDKGKMQEAVAPAAEQISQLYTGARKNIENFLPRGGERNLAVAQLPQAQAGDLARLYAGVQPQAAGALGALASGGASSGVGLSSVGASYGGNAASAGSSLLNYYGQAAQGRGQAIGGAATGLGTYLGYKAATGGLCWLAFATFGNAARAWRLRYHMLYRAPVWLRLLYRSMGRALAAVVRHSTVAHALSYRYLALAEGRL